MNKKNLLTTLLSMFLFFFSCSRDNDAEIKSADVTGKWIIESFEVSNFENSGETIDDLAGLSVRPTLELRADGKSIDNIMNGNYREMDYSITETSITFSQSLAFSHTPTFAYTISKGAMTLTSSDNHGSFTEYTKIVLKK